MVPERPHSDTSVSLAAKLSTDVLVTTLVKLSLKVRGLVVIPLVTISLGAADYGAYVQVTAVATLLGQVTLLGLDTGVVQFRQRYGDDPAVAYWTIAATLSGTGTAGLVAVTLAAPALGRYTLGTAAYAEVFLVGAALVPLTIGFRYGQGYLRATRRIKLYAATDAAEVYLHVAAVAGVVLLTSWGIVGVVAAVVSTRAVVVATIHAAIVRQVGLARPSPTHLRRYLDYSLPTMGTDVARATLTQADRVIVGAVLGAAAVGVYSVAYKVANVLLLFVRPLSIALFPEFARLWSDDRRRVRALTVTALRYFLALAVPAIGGFWLVGDAVLGLLTTAEVAAAAAPLLVVVAVGLLFQGISEIYTELFYAADATRVPLVVQGGAALANVGLNIALVPVLGLPGAALATVATYALAAGATAIGFQRWLRVVPPARSVTAPAVATAVMVGSLWVAGLSWIGTLLLAPLLYATVFLLVGGVDPGELRSLVSVVAG